MVPVVARGLLHVAAVEDVEKRFAGREDQAARKMSDKFLLLGCNRFDAPLASR